MYKRQAFDPAGGSWWNESWNYTRDITIQENSNNTLEEYQITIYLDTKTLISQDKMNSDCSDIRFVWYNESSQDYVDVPYYIDESPGLACNTSNTLIWVRVPYIAANTNTTISLYYGNPDAESESDIVEVFTYSKPKEIYFAIGDFVQRSDIDIISYTDNNQVTLNSNGESITLNRGDIYAGYDATDIQSADSWNVTGPLAFGCPGVDCDTPSPISFAGTEFIRFVDRGGTSKEWFVYAPFSNGTVYFYDAPSSGSFTLIKTLNVQKRTLYTVSDADGSDDYIFLINSTTPILLAFEYSSSDTQMHVPSNKDAWGISEDVAYGYPNTERTLCTQSAACSTTTINGPYREDLGANSDGQGTATHINATKNFGQGQTADSDGYESLVFWPEKELSKEYLIPVAFQYLAGSLTKGSTNSCSWRNGSTGAWASFTPSGSYDYPNPKKIYVGELDSDPADSYGIAGTIINCTYPFFLSIEPNNDDESNILSWKQVRQYIWPEPSVYIEDEWNKSKPRLQANAEFLDTTNIYENQSIILEGNCSEIFGLENVEPKESKKGLIPPEKYGVKVMSLGFFTEKEPIPMRGNAKTDAIKEILAITNWGPLDFLVVDLPPGTGDETLTSVKYVTNSKGAVLVTIPSKISLSVVERTIRLFRELNVPILALINNMAYYSLGEEKISIFGEANVEELAGKYGIDEVVEIPIDPKVSKAIESRSLELIFQSEACAKMGKIVEKLEKIVERQS